MKSKTYLGVDNGVSGTLGVIYPNNKYYFKKTPIKNCLHWTRVEQHVNRIDYNILHEMFSKAKEKSKGNILIILERPFANALRYKAAISAARAYEATIICIEELEIPYIIIDSKDWQKELLPSINTKKRSIKNKGKKKERKEVDTKKLSLEVGNRLFPKMREVRHPDRDGLLIAEWARRNKL